MKVTIPTVRKILRSRLVESRASIYPDRFALGFVLAWSRDPKELRVTWNYDFTDREAIQDPKVAQKRKSDALYSCEDLLSSHFEVERGFDHTKSEPFLALYPRKPPAPLPTPFEDSDPRMGDLYDDSPQGPEDV